MAKSSFERMAKAAHRAQKREQKKAARAEAKAMGPHRKRGRRKGSMSAEEKKRNMKHMPLSLLKANRVKLDRIIENHPDNR